MTSIRSSIPLLRFNAGPMCLGIAAEDVLAVTPEIWDSDLHIASILGVEPGDGERRTIRLPAGDASADAPGVASGSAPAACSFQADMPLDVVECEPEFVLPMPSGVPAENWRPVMGVVEISQTIILLLDIPSVVAALMDRYRRRAT